MRLLDWLRLFSYIKRWIALGLLGIFLVTPSFISLFNYEIKVEVLYLIDFIGISFIIISIVRGYPILIEIKSDKKYFINGYKEKRNGNNLLTRGVKVVVIGGGTGLSVLLRGVKKYTSNITAIVTMADDGGGSGKLREDLGMLPPGDIRNCILALADTEPIMEKLLQYRFKEGSLKGQSFGNLLIAAMVGISDNFEDAIKRINDIFAVTGKVLPVTTNDIILYAKLKNGDIIKGESQIPIKSKEFNSPIERIYIQPEKAEPLKESIEAIANADIVILGPGSLFTSILPNLVIDNIASAIENSKALKVYVSNLMTQPGETDNFSLGDHVKAIFNHTNKKIIDYIYVNSEEIPREIMEKYQKEGASPITITEEDEAYFRYNNIKVIKNNYIEIKKGYLRHNAPKLSQDIIRKLLQDKYRDDRIRFMELNYIMKKSI